MPQKFVGRLDAWSLMFFLVQLFFARNPKLSIVLYISTVLVLLFFFAQDAFFPFLRGVSIHL